MKKGLITTLIILVVIAIIAGIWFFTHPKETVYRVGTEPTWPPFEMIDETTKEETGFDIELIKAIADTQGFKIEIESTSFDGLITGIANGTFDIGASAITITEERKAQMLFSEPYISIGQIMTVREDSELVEKADFTGKIIGAQLGTTGAILAQEWVDAGDGPAEVKKYDTIDLAYLDLKNGQIDGVLADDTMAAGYIKSLGGLKTVGEPYSGEDLGFAVAPEHEDLVKLINEGVAKLKESGEYQKLFDKYFTDAQ